MNMKYWVIFLWYLLYCQCWQKFEGNYFGDGVIDFKYSSRQKYVAVGKSKNVEIYDGIFFRLQGIYKIKENCEFLSFTFSDQESQLFYTCLNIQGIATVSRILLGQNVGSVNQPLDPYESWTFENSSTEMISGCYSLDGQYFIISIDDRLSFFGHNYAGEIEEKDSNKSFSVLSNIPKTNYFVGFDDKIRIFGVLVIESLVTSSESRFSYEYVNQTEIAFNKTLNVLAVDSGGNILVAGEGNVIYWIKSGFGNWDMNKTDEIVIENMKGSQIERMMISMVGNYEWLTISTDLGYIYIIDISYYFQHEVRPQVVEIFIGDSKFGISFRRDHILYFINESLVGLLTECNESQYFSPGRQNRCISCPWGCERCLDSQNCLNCSSGFYLDVFSECMLCSYGCDRCLHEYECEKCDDNEDFILLDLRCVKKEKNVVMIGMIVLSVILFVSLMVFTWMILKLRKKRNQVEAKGLEKNSTSVQMKPRAESHENL